MYTAHTHVYTLTQGISTERRISYDNHIVCDANVFSRFEHNHVSHLVLSTQNHSVLIAFSVQYTIYSKCVCVFFLYFKFFPLHVQRDECSGILSTRDTFMYVRPYRTEYRHTVIAKNVYIVKLYKWIWLCCVYVHDWTTTKYYVHEAFRQRVVFSTYILYHNQIKTHIVLQAKSKLYGERENGEREKESSYVFSRTFAYIFIYILFYRIAQMLKKPWAFAHWAPLFKITIHLSYFAMPKPILSSGWVNGDIH